MNSEQEYQPAPFLQPPPPYHTSHLLEENATNPHSNSTNSNTSTRSFAPPVRRLWPAPTRLHPSAVLGDYTKQLVRIAAG